jgi:hypothetical protein
MHDGHQLQFSRLVQRRSGNTIASMNYLETLKKNYFAFHRALDFRRKMADFFPQKHQHMVMIFPAENLKKVKALQSLLYNMVLVSRCDVTEERFNIRLVHWLHLRMLICQP